MSILTTWPFSPGDLIADTQDMQVDEIGAYVLLMVAMWQSDDGTLPDNDLILAEISRVSFPVWRSRIRSAIGARLRLIKDHRVTNPQLYREFYRQHRAMGSAI